MFFIISKVLGFITSPYLWFWILLVTGVVFIKKKAGKRLLIASVVVLLLFSNAFISNWAITKWERPYTNIRANYKYAIVLGGMSKYDTTFKRVQAGMAFDRIYQALSLYKQGKVEKIVITGGSGSLSHPELVETPRLLASLVALGFPDSVFITESKSRNTRENAKFTKAILANYPNGRCLLITSSFHMRRAEACFKKAGYDFDTYPVNSLKREYLTVQDYLIPDGEALGNWNILLKEWVGYATYKVMGYI